MAAVHPHGLDAVLFDMDGLLLDTEPMWLIAERMTMAQLGADWTDVDQAQCLGGPLDRVVHYMIEKSGTQRSLDDVRTHLLTEVERQFRDDPVHWQPGAKDLLAELYRAGVPCALVSASYRRLVDTALDRVVHEVASDVFAVTVAGDEVARTKPHPDPYLSAAERLGARIERCVVLEDSPTGVAAGQAAGALVVAVPHMVHIEATPRTRVVQSLAAVDLEVLRGWLSAATSDADVVAR